MVLRLAEKLCLPGHVDLAALLVQKRCDEIHDDGHKARRISGASGHAGQQFGRQLLGSQFRDACIQDRAEKFQVCLCQLDRKTNEFILDGTVAQHHDQNKTAAVRKNQVEPLDRQPGGTRRHSIGRQIRHLRNQLANLRDDLINLLHFEFHRLIDRFRLIG